MTTGWSCHGDVLCGYVYMVAMVTMLHSNHVRYFPYVSVCCCLHGYWFVSMVAGLGCLWLYIVSMVTFFSFPWLHVGEGASTNSS